MRRIDLLCKLFGPLFIALIDGASTEIAIIVTFGMNIASVLIEYFAIARVYHKFSDLQQPKQRRRSNRQEDSALYERQSLLAHNWNHVKQIMSKSAADFDMYCHHNAFLPSIAGALLYLTVLNFAGQMVTYLLAVGYTSTQIAIARTLSVAFEVLATWVAPWIMDWVGPVRAGLWLSSSQIIMLATGIVLYYTFYEDNPVLSASGLVGGTILSRVGLRGFDLCAQLIVQEVKTPLLLQKGFAKHICDRRLKATFAVHFHLWKQPGRTLLNSSHTRRLLFFSVLSSLSGRP